MSLQAKLPRTWQARMRSCSMAGVLVIASGLLTIAAPWLMQLPAMHGVLEALGCRSLST